MIPRCEMREGFLFEFLSDSLRSAEYKKERGVSRELATRRSAPTGRVSIRRVFTDYSVADHCFRIIWLTRSRSVKATGELTIRQQGNQC